MDFQKAGILLEKIHALFKNMSADSEDVSEIEKDLMRAYLRQFYEHFMPHEEDRHEPLPSPLPLERKEKRRVEVLNEEEETEKKPQPQPPKEELPARPPAPTPRVIVVEEDEDEEPVKLPPVVVEKPPKKKYVAEDAEDIDTLFEHHQATELSEKLSELPIQDLNKAMGLNEKIFTINELFDGDQEAFKQSIQTLNGFHSFEEARNFLVQEIAIRYNWALPDRKNKAKNFIKLIRRRYNA
ncbi:MAG: hypothetical protein H6563_00240 [Lewinellaceae bacterium]|nr:hypothetical protein [Lewinellaceae bacterium]